MLVGKSANINLATSLQGTPSLVYKSIFCVAKNLLMLVTKPKRKYYSFFPNKISVIYILLKKYAPVKSETIYACDIHKQGIHNSSVLKSYTQKYRPHNEPIHSIKIILTYTLHVLTNTMCCRSSFPIGTS